MSRTIKHPITKGFLDQVEHDRKERKQQRAQDIELLNASFDLIVKED